jgi:tetratricopeptide (TPR) repeat protein
MEAIGSYKKYIELIGGRADSTSGRAYYEAGMAYLLLGGYGDARDYFAKVLSIPVEPKDIYFYYARAFQGVNEYDSALTYYNKQIEWVKKQGQDFKSGIGDDELYRRMGECYESEKNYQSTIDYYKKSLEIDSTQDRLFYGIAIAYNYLADYRNALIYYMKRIAMGVDERGWSIYYNAATSALYLAEKASQNSPTGSTPADTASGADPLAGIDLNKLAAQYLEKVIEFKPDNTKAASMLASVYLYQLSECAKAVQLYEKVLAAEPDNCDALKSLGYADFSGLCTKNYSRSLDYLNRALSCYIKKGGAECGDPNLLLWIAQVYEFRASDSRNSNKAAAKKDYKAAFDWYNKVLKCDPGNSGAKEGIDRVKFEY